MNTTASSTIRQKLSIALRFALFGIGGFWVMLFSAAMLMGTVFQHEFFSGFLFFPLTVIGAAMMLHGVGQWGRWAYLWVFLSMPISLFLLVLIPGTSNDKGLPVLVAAVAMICSYMAVRAYYAARIGNEKEPGKIK